jgi:3-phosphoshikimate 1-carboxyvinyltransferase
MSITISHPTSILKGRAELPLSKSESNRILILQALSKGKIKVEASGLSDARDTRLLQAALASDDLEINVEDAGTAMRFLTAFYCATGQHKILTGSVRMCQRPIGILVNALRDIGFNIRYLMNEGFPPIEVRSMRLSELKNEVHIAGNISSQYISALMMIAPVLDRGLTIHFTTSLSSKPYIDLTRKLMLKAGIESEISEDKIHIPHQSFKKNKLQADADWSSASYWFSMAALAKDAEILLPKLSLDSMQGDKQIAEWCKYFGVIVKVVSGGLYLYSKNPNNPENHGNHINHINPSPHFDFTDYPDLAQTMIVLCAARNIKATFTGLHSLRIKETDRIAALQNELLKFGVKLLEADKGKYGLSGTFRMSHQTIKTYNDHRMAMAFAPLALLGEISIEHHEVVEKSYHSFWAEMKNVGFEFQS